MRLVPHSTTFFRLKKLTSPAVHYSNPPYLDTPVPRAAEPGRKGPGPLTDPFLAGLTVARMLPTLRTATAASVQGRSHLMPGSQRHRSYGSAQRMRMPLQGAGPGLGWPIRAAESLPQPQGGSLSKLHLTSGQQTSPAFSSKKLFLLLSPSLFFFPLSPPPAQLGQPPCSDSS